MRTTKARVRAKLQGTLGAILILVSGMALAETPPHVEKDEPKVRFQHGVDLFRDGDFRAAVIEFKRAYELSPNPRVLYSLGEASLEAQDYPAAQAALRRYLDEVGKDVPAARRAQVETDLRKLEARIAKIMVRSNVDDAEINVDDVPMGRTPLTAPLVVGAGRRRIVLTAAGIQQSRTVDLAGGDNTTIEIPLSLNRDPAKDAAASLGHDTSPGNVEPTSFEHAAHPPATSVHMHGGLSAGQTAGVITTGLLAAGAGVLGVLTLMAKRDFDDRVDNHPSTKADIDSARGRTRDLALTTDIVGGVAVFAGAATLLSITLGGSSRSSERTAKVGLVIKPTGLDVTGSF